MGASEWGVLVRSKEEAKRALAAMQSHNECENFEEVQEALRRHAAGQL